MAAILRYLVLYVSSEDYIQESFFVRLLIGGVWEFSPLNCSPVAHRSRLKGRKIAVERLQSAIFGFYIVPIFVIFQCKLNPKANLDKTSAFSVQIQLAGQGFHQQTASQGSGTPVGFHQRVQGDPTAPVFSGKTYSI